LRLVGRFFLLSEDKPASKKIFEKFSKRRLLAGSERLCVALLAEREKPTSFPQERG